MRYIFLGGLACLLGATFCLRAASAQEPTLAPVPENASANDGTLTTSGAFVDNAYAYGCPTGNCQANGHHCGSRYNYRCRYCRPEPFTRNDCRDQYTFSAQGYGVPVTVPLAPVVCQQFNYGWGLPASRLTNVPFGWQTYRPHGPTAQEGVQTQPVAYWPNDTMQQGFYYMRTPW